MSPMLIDFPLLHVNMTSPGDTKVAPVEAEFYTVKVCGAVTSEEPLDADTAGTPG